MYVGKRLQGFTLIELIVVMVIMVGVIATVAPAVSRSMGGADLAGGARKLVTLLKVCRNQAIVAGLPVRLSLEPTQRRYKVSGDKHIYNWPENAVASIEKTNGIVDIQKEIVFYPDGSSSGGQIKLSAERRFYIIDINWITGRILINEA